VSDRTHELRLERELFVRALMPTLRGDGAARLAGLLEARELPEGALLFREGAPPEEFFFIVEGRVVMEAPGLPTWSFSDRSLVGMVDMTAWRPHRRSCRTTRPTRVLVGRSAAWLDMLDDDPVMGEEAIHGFAQRLHDLTSEVGSRLAPEPIVPDLGLSPPLAIHERALVLRDSSLLLRASTQSIASLAQVAEELTLRAGAELFARGHGERALFVVASGVIALRWGSERLTRVGPLRFLAPAAALSGHLGEYSAHAETAAVVLRIREEEYYDQSDEHPDLTRAAMAFMAIEQEKLMDLRPPNE